jgi:hypothetical protein
MAKDIWLISSKDIEELVGNIDHTPRLIHKGNSSLPYDVFDISFNALNKKVSLGTFYYDLCTSEDNCFIKHTRGYLTGKNQINTDLFSHKMVIETLKEKYSNNISEQSSLLSFNIWRLKCGSEEFPVFFTRCFPNKEMFISDFGTLNSDDQHLSYYWLISYLETICMILGIDVNSIDDYSFKFLLHDGDIGKKKLVGCVNFSEIFSQIPYFDNVAPIFRAIKKRQTDIIYYYQHANSSYFYRNIIMNGNFFNGCTNPSQQLESYLNPKMLNGKFLSLINSED